MRFKIDQRNSYCFAFQPNFGCLFDIDGVLLRGAVPIPVAKTAIDLLKGKDGKLRVPIAFVTNACANVEPKVKQLMNTFNIEVRSSKFLLVHTILMRIHTTQGRNALTCINIRFNATFNFAWQ